MKKSRLLEIIREEISGALNEMTIDVQNPLTLKNPQKQALINKAKQTTKNPKLGTAEFPVDFVEEEELKEMAKLTTKAGEGEPVTFGNNKPINLTPLGKKTAEFIKANPNLSKSALLNALIADKEVSGLLDKKAGEEFAQNQTNKFAALVRGEREVGPRGPKADPNKPKAEPKTPGVRGRKPMDSKPKSSTTDMDDEDKEAASSAGSDSTAKALGKISSRKDKIVKAYKDLKPQVQDKIAKSKGGDKEAADWLKNTWTPILKAYNKAQQVNI
jgi:hypothetical protein